MDADFLREDAEKTPSVAYWQLTDADTRFTEYKYPTVFQGTQIWQIVQQKIQLRFGPILRKWSEQDERR
jgi:hypothetical protein